MFEIKYNTIIYGVLTLTTVINDLYIYREYHKQLYMYRNGFLLGNICLKSELSRENINNCRVFRKIVSA